MKEDLFFLGVKALIRNQSGEFLLLKANIEGFQDKNYPEHWDLPGGRIEKGETPQTALEREIREETGLSGIEISRHLGIYPSSMRIPYSPEGTAGLILSIYICTAVVDADIAISHEHTQFAWFGAAEAAKLLKIKFSGEFCDVLKGL